MTTKTLSASQIRSLFSSCRTALQADVAADGADSIGQFRLASALHAHGLMLSALSVQDVAGAAQASAERDSELRGLGL